MRVDPLVRHSKNFFIWVNQLGRQFWGMWWLWSIFLNRYIDITTLQKYIVIKNQHIYLHLSSDEETSPELEQDEDEEKCVVGFGADELCTIIKSKNFGRAASTLVFIIVILLLFFMNIRHRTQSPISFPYKLCQRNNI
jgi:hypothetical protein